LIAICAVVVLLAVAGLVWTFATGLEFNIDGLLMLAVCLMMGGVFSLMLLLLVKEAGWLPPVPFPRKKAATFSPASTANPGAGKGK